MSEARWIGLVPMNPTIADHAAANGSDILTPLHIRSLHSVVQRMYRIESEQDTVGLDSLTATNEAAHAVRLLKRAAGID